MELAGMTTLVQLLTTSALLSFADIPG